MEGAFGGHGVAGEVITIIGKRFARRDARGLSDDAIALDDLDGAVGGADDPFAPEEADGGLGKIGNRQKVHEGVGGLGRKIGVTMVDHLIDGDPEAWKFLSGSLHWVGDKRGRGPLGSHKSVADT